MNEISNFFKHFKIFQECPILNYTSTNLKIQILSRKPQKRHSLVLKNHELAPEIGSSKIQNSIRHYLPKKQRRQIAVFRVKFFVNANSRSKFEDL